MAKLCANERRPQSEFNKGRHRYFLPDGEDAELLVYLVDEENGHLYRRVTPCHLGPVQLGTAQLSLSATLVSPNLYELANGGHAVVYI